MNKSIAAALLTASSLAIKLQTQEIFTNDSQERVYQLFSTDGYNHADAAQNCADMGGVLAVISSAEENERAAAAYVGLVDMVWIGAIEQANSGPEGFGWPSGEEWHYSNWAAGEPNGPTTFPQPCTIMGWAGSQQTWWDDTCDRPRGALCSFDPVPVVEPVQYENKTYRLLVDGKLEWQQAEEACQATGGSLAVITSQEDHEHAQDALMLEGQDKAWLGGYRQEENAGPEGFAWTDGTEWTFAPWANGEPNNYGTGESCLQMGYHSIDTWNDMFCDRPQYPLCSYTETQRHEIEEHDHHDDHSDNDDHDNHDDHEEIYPEYNEDGTPVNVNTPY